MNSNFLKPSIAYLIGLLCARGHIYLSAKRVIIVGAIGNYGSVYWNHIKPSAKIVQINPKQTGFDSSAFLNIHSTCDEVFAELS